MDQQLTLLERPKENEGDAVWRESVWPRTRPDFLDRLMPVKDLGRESSPDHRRSGIEAGGRDEPSLEEDRSAAIASLLIGAGLLYLPIIGLLAWASVLSSQSAGWELSKPFYGLFDWSSRPDER
jgi:hypothetical protein